MSEDTASSDDTEPVDAITDEDEPLVPLGGFNPFSVDIDKPPTHTVTVVWEPEPGLIQTVSHETWLEGLFWGLFGQDVALNVHDDDTISKVVIYKRALVRKVEIIQHTLLDAAKYFMVGTEPDADDGGYFNSRGYL